MAVPGAGHARGHVPQGQGASTELAGAGELEVNDLPFNAPTAAALNAAFMFPAANDISKIIVDLERIGDEASKIAKRARDLAEDGQAPRGYVECRHIGHHVRRMVQEALDAFARMDTEQAFSVAREDKAVDQEYKTAMREMVTFMMEDPRSIGRVLNILWVLRSLERVGDHARNVAEHVIYLVKGTDVRHIGLKRMEAEVKKDSSADE